MYDDWILVLELVGTVAFSVSGAMTGIKKHMDIFGVAILGLTTAVGGGVVRDLILGITPPATFRNPIYAVVAIVTALTVFWPPVRKVFMGDHRAYDISIRIMDSVGLGVFTAVGVRTAFAHGGNYSFFLLVFVGVITGVGGGILRDVLAGNTPYIFVRHIYACASLAGAALCCLLWPYLPDVWAMVAGICIVIALRLLSAHYKWNLLRA